MQTRLGALWPPLTSAEHPRYDSFPSSVTVFSESPIMDPAKSELTRGVQGILGSMIPCDIRKP